MDLKLSGKVTDILETQSGESKNGPWKKRDFILETGGEYPKKVCITQWGDQIDTNSVQKGSAITAFIDIQSREYNGRWYTDVKAWKIENEGGQAGSDSATPQASSKPVPPSIDFSDIDDGDDGLPF